MDIDAIYRFKRKIWYPFHMLDYVYSKEAKSVYFLPDIPKQLKYYLGYTEMVYRTTNINPKCRKIGTLRSVYKICYSSTNMYVSFIQKNKTLFQPLPIMDGLNWFFDWKIVNRYRLKYRENKIQSWILYVSFIAAQTIKTYKKSVF